MHKITITIIFVIIAGTIWGGYYIAYAANNSGFDNVRKSVIASDSIPDTYLIEPTSTYWNAKNMTAVYERLKVWTLSKDESIPSEQAIQQNRTITVASNIHPLADAGMDQTVRYGDVVRLNGSASTDTDNGIISHMWRQTTGPAVAISDNMLPSPTFTAPDSAGIFTFELTVSDGYDTATDTVTITVMNRPPIPDAGMDRTVQLGDVVSLDGSASTDPDNDVLSYMWNQTAGPIVTLSDNAAESPTFTAPYSETTLTFEITISDGEYFGTDTVTITVKHPNRAPTANAGDDITAKAGEQVTLNGSASTDPDNDILTYTWGVIIGPSHILSNTTGPSVTVTVPSGEDVLGIFLSVSDGEFTSQDLVVIMVE